MTPKHPLNSCPKCGLFNQSCKCKTLKQQLQELLKNYHMPHLNDKGIEDLSNKIQRLYKEWLEQNRQELINRNELNQMAISFANELLGELGK